MAVDPAQPPAAYGFATILESADHGIFGGYLVLSPWGRPLEFRCSTPVLPSRAQRILYGPTLRPYLLAEVIGQALLQGSTLPVRAVLTDQLDMLSLAALRAEPVLHVSARNETPAAYERGSSEAAIEFDDYVIRTYSDVMLSSEAVIATLGELTRRIDLCEPFDRVRAALIEAQLSPTENVESGNGILRAA